LYHGYLFSNFRYPGLIYEIIILKQLYKELEKWFKSKNCPYVIVDVVTKNPRKKLYKAFGFETVLEEMRKII